MKKYFFSLIRNIVVFMTFPLCQAVGFASCPTTKDVDCLHVIFYNQNVIFDNLRKIGYPNDAIINSYVTITPLYNHRTQEGLPRKIGLNYAEESTIEYYKKDIQQTGYYAPFMIHAKGDIAGKMGTPGHWSCQNTDLANLPIHQHTLERPLHFEITTIATDEGGWNPQTGEWSFFCHYKIIQGAVLD